MFFKQYLESKKKREEDMRRQRDEAMEAMRKAQKRVKLRQALLPRYEFLHLWDGQYCNANVNHPNVLNEIPDQVMYDA